jgi:hypothetical protein
MTPSRPRQTPSDRHPVGPRHFAARRGVSRCATTNMTPSVRQLTATGCKSLSGNECHPVTFHPPKGGTRFTDGVPIGVASSRAWYGVPSTSPRCRRLREHDQQTPARLDAGSERLAQRAARARQPGSARPLRTQPCVKAPCSRTDPSTPPRRYRLRERGQHSTTPVVAGRGFRAQRRCSGVCTGKRLISLSAAGRLGGSMADQRRMHTLQRAEAMGFILPVLPITGAVAGRFGGLGT